MTNISKITTLLERIEDLAPSGFAIAFHIRLTSADFQFQTYPKAWIDTYSEKGYVMVDPIVHFGFTQTGSIRWSDLKEADEHNVLEQSLAFGMNYGVAIATDTGGSRSCAGLARPDREYSDEEIATLTQYVQELHDLTASKTGMPKELRDELIDLSIQMTHPGST